MLVDKTCTAATIPADSALPSYALGSETAEALVGVTYVGKKSGYESNDRRNHRHTIRVPDNPPFKAYVDNMPHDVDEVAIERFFGKLQIQSIYINRFRDTGKVKGCYVEFSSKEHLLHALKMDGNLLVRKPARVKVAEPRRNDRQGAYGNARRDFTENFNFKKRSDDRTHNFGQRSSRGNFGIHDMPKESARRSGRWMGPEDVNPENISKQSEEAVSTLPQRERPKLNLLPRGSAVKEKEENKKIQKSGSNNPFGDAKPKDTAAKILELEERDIARKELGKLSLQTAPDVDSCADQSNTSTTKARNYDAREMKNGPERVLKNEIKTQMRQSSRGDHSSRGNGRQGKEGQHNANRRPIRKSSKDDAPRKVINEIKQSSRTRSVLQEEDAPKTKVSNVFDILGEIDA